MQKQHTELEDELPQSHSLSWEVMSMDEDNVAF